LMSCPSAHWQPTHSPLPLAACGAIAASFQHLLWPYWWQLHPLPVVPTEAQQCDTIHLLLPTSRHFSIASRLSWKLSGTNETPANLQKISTSGGLWFQRVACPCLWAVKSGAALNFVKSFSYVPWIWKTNQIQCWLVENSDSEIRMLIPPCFHSAIIVVLAISACYIVGFKSENMDRQMYLKICEPDVRKSRDFRDVLDARLPREPAIGQMRKGKWEWIRRHIFHKKRRIMFKILGMNNLVLESEVSPVFTSCSTAWNARHQGDGWKINLSCRRPWLVCDHKDFIWFSR
jgi:hypothetical protein